MLRFECDYGEGAHPKILERLLETNLEQTPGYGKDEHCERAKTLIRQACGLPQSTIEFVSGGTQANQIVIAAILKPYQGVDWGRPQAWRIRVLARSQCSSFP